MQDRYRQPLSANIRDEGRDGLLRRTRQIEVVDRIPLGNGYVICPESYQRGLYPHWGILRGNNEAFLLTERSFYAVNQYFLGLPDILISEIEERKNQPVVVDLGGGRDGTSAGNIAANHPGVQVINIDIVALPEEKGNYLSQAGSVIQNPLDHESVDLAYSHQLLPFLHSSKRDQALGEVARILKPGGVAILDIEEGWHVTDNLWKNVLEKFRISYPGFTDYIGQKSYGGDFVILVNDPQRDRISRFAELIRK